MRQLRVAPARVRGRGSEGFASVRGTIGIVDF
jgi:hypothetical protein